MLHGALDRSAGQSRNVHPAISALLAGVKAETANGARCG